MYANPMGTLIVGLGLLVGLMACDPPKPAVPTTVCYVTDAVDQLYDTPPTLMLERSFTYVSGQLTAISERSASQQVAYQLTYQDTKVVTATSSLITMTLEHDPKTGLINQATMTKGGQIQSVFTMTYTPANRLSTLSEARQVLVSGSSVVSRAYSFSYTDTGNVSTEHVRFTFLNGSTLDQETDYTVSDNIAPYASFPEPALLTVLSVGQQFEPHPGRLWHNNALVTYHTYTFDGTNRLLAESATFTNQFDANGNLTARAQTTNYYIPAGSTSTSAIPTRQTFAYECR